MIKNCRICGAEFDVANPNYCLCSDECRKIAYRESNRISVCKNRNKDIYKDKSRIYYMKHRKLVNKKCGMCGEVLPDGRATYCLNCLLKDHAQNPSIVTRSRLYNRGFDSLMIEEEIANRGLR